MRVSAYRYGTVSGGEQFEFDTLDELRAAALSRWPAFFGVPGVGLVFDDEGIKVTDERLLVQSTTYFIAPVGVEVFMRGSRAEDEATAQAQTYRGKLQGLLGIFLSSVSPCACRNIVEQLMRKALNQLMHNAHGHRFGLVAFEVECGAALSPQLSDPVSPLDDATKGILAEMAVVLEQYDAVSQAVVVSPGGRGPRQPRGPIEMSWARDLPGITDLRAKAGICVRTSMHTGITQMYSVVTGEHGGGGQRQRVL